MVHMCVEVEFFLVGGKGKQVERVRIKVIGDFWRMRNIVSHSYLPFRI